MCYTPIDASTIEEAVSIVVKNKASVYVFRHNRELIDLRGDFRFFIYKNNGYVLKVLSVSKANQEFSLSTEVANRLKGEKIGGNRDHAAIRVTNTHRIWPKHL